MSVAQPPNLTITQNFLKNPHLVSELIDRSSLSPADLVYEIGPGRGILTAQLARRCRLVMAVEKDPALASSLRQDLSHLANLSIRTGDVLQDRLPQGPYKVFANIPFNITSAIVARLTSTANPPQDAYLVMQKEAAEIYLGKPRQTLRAVLLYPWFESQLVHRFHRRDFKPQPNVDVVMLRMRKRSPALVDRSQRQLYGDFTAYCFTAWRPTLAEPFKTIFTFRQRKHIARMGIDLESAPAGLEFESWLSLFMTFKEVASPQALGLVSGSQKRLQGQQRKLKKIHRTRINP